jgi:phage shock protein A
LLLQAPPADPAVFSEWDKVGIVGILIAVICLVVFAAYKLLQREQQRTDNAEGRADRLRDAMEGLIRAYERLATEALAAERDATAEIQNANFQTAQLTTQIAELRHALAALQLEVSKIKAG